MGSYISWPCMHCKLLKVIFCFEGLHGKTNYGRGQYEEYNESRKGATMGTPKFSDDTSLAKAPQSFQK